ncbi:hypothetical protein CRG98_015735 [Punica granatum]|uniref:Uncharacterized protein n=1 Tax=Punica granatum TaxID=22663 RepID=A0A2I0K5N3_PUNGR|nr:hypothetical protein CRG98_015735 [Punica granatum]
MGQAQRGEDSVKCTSRGPRGFPRAEMQGTRGLYVHLRGIMGETCPVMIGQSSSSNPLHVDEAGAYTFPYATGRLPQPELRPTHVASRAEHKSPINPEQNSRVVGPSPYYVWTYPYPHIRVQCIANASKMT